MAIATVDELRHQFRRQNESSTVKIKDARRSSAIRNETQKVELKAQMDQMLVQREKEAQARYATELKESQDEAERLRKSLEGSLMQQLASGIENGVPVMIENIQLQVDAVLNPVIGRQKIKRGRNFVVKLGDKEVDYHPKFKLYLQTKLSNPCVPRA